tara:strand:- start:9051 stop:9308 length:258 start_codon:yes stop_codon:yes gene_type:complete
MPIAYIITALVWTTHPTLPLGLINSNQAFESKELCEELLEETSDLFAASVGNFLLRTETIRLKKVLSMNCLTLQDIKRYNTLLGH